MEADTRQWAGLRDGIRLALISLVTIAAMSRGFAPAARADELWPERILAALDGAPGDEFGFSVSMDGNLAAVGAPGYDNDRGAVYIFRRNGIDWVQEYKVPGNTAGDCLATPSR